VVSSSVVRRVACHDPRVVRVARDRGRHRPLRRVQSPLHIPGGWYPVVLPQPLPHHLPDGHHGLPDGLLQTYHPRSQVQRLRPGVPRHSGVPQSPLRRALTEASWAVLLSVPRAAPRTQLTAHCIVASHRRRGRRSEAARPSLLFLKRRTHAPPHAHDSPLRLVFIPADGRADLHRRCLSAPA